MDDIIVPLKIGSDCLPLKLKWISAGGFIMGDNEISAWDDFETKPIGTFEVIITRGYWLGVYPVTQGQWFSVMGTNPSRFKGANLPVTEISWDDSLDFCNRLDTDHLSIPEGYVFNLPTEAQWEYACRAGNSYKYQIGDTLQDLSRIAWHSENISSFTIQNVGQKQPNQWGFYDMLGNIMEWCFDSPIEYPKNTTQFDWIGGSEEGIRILRGGSILVSPPEALTCGIRAHALTDPYIVSGFRLCLRYK